MTNATRCVACGTEAQDGDFCANPTCRQYLAWDVPEEQVQPTPEHPRSTQETTVAAANPDPEADIPPSHRRAAALSLVDFDELESAPCQVVAGGQRALTVELRNQSTIVDEFEFSVRNIPASWWSVDPAEGIHLLPFGAGRRESSLGQAVITLMPPRTSAAIAGEQQIVIAVHSVATDEEVANVAITLDILPFQAVRGSIHPDVSLGRRRGNFTFTVRNTSNTPTDLVLGGYNPSERCGVSVTPPTLYLGPGQQSDANAVVRPATPQIVGRATPHTIHLFAEPTGTALPGYEPERLSQRLFRAGSAQATKEGAALAKKAKTKVPKPPKAPKVPKGVAGAAKELAGGGQAQEGATAEDAEAPASAASPAPAVAAEASTEKQADPTAYACTYRQRAWIPWWTIIPAVLALLVIIWLVYTALHKVTVPNVIGHPISAARNEIAAGHLNPVEHASPGCRLRVVDGKVHCAVAPRLRKHKPCATRVPPKMLSGDVYREVPAPSTRVAPNTIVILCTKVLSGPAPVPDLFGMKSQVAIQTLARDGFAIGDIEPYPPPQGQVVVRQTPPAFRRWCKRKGRRFPCRSEKVNVTLGVVSDVPNLVGKPPADARQKVEKAALEIGTFTGKLKSKPEIVVGQAPAAGSQVIAGHKVRLMLGSRVPRLGGLKFEAARKKLHGVGLKMQRVRRPWANAVVIWQNPKHGRPLRAGGVVHVHFGARVPNLFARTVVDARKALANEGLHLGTISPSVVPPGRAFVVTQGIRRKRLVGLGTKIKVAMGTTVPDLSNLTIDQAKRDLKKLHLTLGAVAKMVQPGYSGPPVIAEQSKSPGKVARFDAKIGVKTLVAPPSKKKKAAASKKHKGKTTNQAHAKAARSEHRNSLGTRGAGRAHGSNG